MVKFNFEKNNQLFYGDNISILRAMPKAIVDLCYIDPPFNSKRNYFQIYNGVNEEVDKAQSQAFMDTWYWGDDSIEGLRFISDIQNLTDYRDNTVISEQTKYLIEGLHKVLGDTGLMAYLISMTLRIIEIHRVLKDTGSFYLHCDPTASHYLKLICDSVFCAKNRNGQFLNEIVWCYRGAGYPKKDFGKRHDIIFRYAKSQLYCFNLDSVREDYAETTKERFKHFIGNKRQGNDYGIQKLHPLGKQPDDWWQIQPIAPSAKERLGYPTQKPEALLERIIKASSNEGDIVLDSYCGCGTTVAVAQRLNRRWIGIDITYQSIGLILKRLKDGHADNWNEIEKTIYLSGIPEDMESARLLANNRDDRLRKEFEKWAILTYTNNQGIINDKKGKDQGIDGVSYFLKDRDMKTNQDITGKILYQVKSGKVTSKDIRDLIGVCSTENGDMAILICLEPPTQDMSLAAKRSGSVVISSMGREFNIITIVTIEEIIMNNIRLNLPITYAITKSATQKKIETKDLYSDSK